MISGRAFQRGAVHVIGLMELPTAVHDTRQFPHTSFRVAGCETDVTDDGMTD